MNPDQLGALLAASPSPLPRELTRQLAIRPPGPTALLALLERPDLTTDDVTAAIGNLDRPGFGSRSDLRSAILARREDLTGAEMEAEVARAVDAGARGSRSRNSGGGYIVRTVMRHPRVTDHVLDLFAGSQNVAIVAAYARHTGRGARDRDQALARLEHLLGPSVRRLAPEVADDGARALELLLAEDCALGRARLLATHTRPILLALSGAEDTISRRCFAHLDTETRAHLVRTAVIPVFTEARPTEKAKSAASAIVVSLIGDLDADVLRAMQPLLPRRLSDRIVSRLREMTGSPYTRTDLTLGKLTEIGENKSDRPAAAAWLVDICTPAAATIGWDAVLSLADQIPAGATLADLRDTILGVAAPAELDTAS